MAANRAIHQLQRELREKPLKAAVLGLTLVAAIWFWAPQIGKWFGQSKPAPETTANTIVRAKHSGTQGQSAAADKPQGPGWQEVRKSIAGDPNMKPATLPSYVRDPFAKIGDVAQQDGEAPAAKKYITPQDAGVNLTSTVVGARQKTAMVDGRPYHEGQSIRAPKADVRFQLVDIQPRYVVLESDGRRYKLRVPGFDLEGIND